MSSSMNITQDGSSEAVIPVPLIPDFTSPHGPATRWLLRRTLIGLGVLWLGALALVAADVSARLTAFGLGLLLPGGGQFATGHPVLGFLALFGFVMAIFLWWLCGNVLLLPLAWLVPAVLAAALPFIHILSWMRWAIPLALVAIVAMAIVYPRIRFRRQRAVGRRYNEQLATEQPVLRKNAPTPTASEATIDDLKTLRYLADMALQPIDKWDGFFYLPFDQFREGALRYQLNFVSYATAMYQYTHTPAFTGYLAEAQRNMITKMTHKKVWSYWSLENLWGNLRWNPDPIIDDNIMYSGYLGLMLGLYETTTGDTRYHEPGCLPLRWNDTTVFAHDAGTITEALADNFARARGGQFPCEPNWIYPMCNTFGVNSLVVYDRLCGTINADAVVSQVRESYENGDYCEPNGRLTAARSEYFGFRHPMIGNMGDGITMYFLNTFVPDIARRTWWLNSKHHIGAENGTVNPRHRTWNLLDPGNYGIFTDRFTRAVLAANAREFGDNAAADALVDSLAPRIVEKNGARRYRGLSVWGNLYLAMAKFGREDSFRGLVCDGFPAAWRTGPRLNEVAYPDVLVTYAVTDGHALDLVLRPGNGPVRTTISFDRLQPFAHYRVFGALGDSLVADAEGRAQTDIGLTDRLKIRIEPIS